jgi:hypothetical protein
LSTSNLERVNDTVRRDSSRKHTLTMRLNLGGTRVRRWPTRVAGPEDAGKAEGG